MPSFDFSSLAVGLAAISLGLVGTIMAGSMLFPEVAERYKQRIPTILIGVVIVAVAGFILAALGG